MKRIIVIGLAFLPLLIWSQRKPKIKGNRQVTEVREELPPIQWD